MKKSIFRRTAFGGLFALLSMLLTGLTEVLNIVPNRLKQTISEFLGAFTGGVKTTWGFISLPVFVLAFILTVLLIRSAVKKEKKEYVIASLILFLALSFLPFLLIFADPSTVTGGLSIQAIWFTTLLFLLDLFSIIILFSVVKELGCPVCYVKKECHQEDRVEKISKVVEPVQKGISLDEVRLIIHEELDAHIEELHTYDAECECECECGDECECHSDESHKQEEVQEITQEEAQDDEVLEESLSQDINPAFKGTRKPRVTFPEKLEKSEPEIRQKYEGLRDYLLSYGVKNRVSNSGDTFSLHREKYAFITFVGKHIKCCFALDPEAYSDSTITVTKNETKKFEDLPLQFRVKSDLSFRRACKLIDDVMAKKGLTKKD